MWLLLHLTELLSQAFGCCVFTSHQMAQFSTLSKCFLEQSGESLRALRVFISHIPRSHQLCPKKDTIEAPCRIKRGRASSELGLSFVSFNNELKQPKTSNFHSFPIPTSPNVNSLHPLWYVRLE